MKSLLFIFIMMLAINTSPKIDFGENKSGERWQVIVDGVMGGLSRGEKEVKSNSLLFKGSVSLENNGGFSSLKSVFQRTDLSDYETVRIRLRGKGQIFALTMETDQRWYFPYFKKNIVTQSEDWEEVTLSLKDFSQYRIGQETGKRLSKEDQVDIIRLGITTNDKKAGDFELEIDYILFE